MHGRKLRDANRPVDFRRLAAIGVLALVLAAGVRGQPPQQFEVAVIRPSLAATNGGTSFNVFEGGRLRIINEPVKLLIRAAFQIQNAQIAGGPEWLESDRYDIEAKTGRPEKIEPGQMSPLLQGLLADRFNLKFHREMRELTVYALVVEKNQRSGPKLKASTEGAGTAMNTHGGPGKSQQLVGTAVSMGALAGYVGNRLGRIVVDKTGLSESYDFTLEWAPDGAPETSVPSLVTALQEQLGLKLESQKSPMEVLVIDNLRRPSEN
ncbi:MAG TPA: TIGR03435 family protein [Bryobacteraceae bacterium]|nr:TIGR03435 family protein [Bryobacteraceae bacterium]